MSQPPTLPLEAAIARIEEPAPATADVDAAMPRPLSPYPGLRPFRSEERLLFCGRSQNRIELLSRLEDSRFLAVVGASGSGKSSLVMAGLLPDIAEGLLLTVDPEARREVYFKPGRNPFRSLAEGLARTFDARGEAPEIERLLRHSSAQGFRKVLDRFLLPSDSGEAPAIIVIADQFEEIFRFASLEKGEVDSADFLAKRGGIPVLDTVQNEAQAFVDLLLQAYVLKEYPIYVVLTMRSDFLHRCEAFDRLPGILSTHQYLTPRPQRDQLADSIAIPATHFQATMQPELVNLILNELSPEQDQLPVLEHSLARLWQYAVAAQPEPRVLRIEDYHAIGGIQNALSLHGREILARVAEASAGTLRDDEVGRFFRCLAEWDPAGALIRRPRTVGKVAAESGLAIDQVKLIANHFRGANNHWLTPMITEAEDLDPERMLDLTHESLLRKWDRYSDRTGWMLVEKERRDAFRRVWERMNESSEAPPLQQRLLGWLKLGPHAVQPANMSYAQLVRYRHLLSGPEPTEAWAQRYGGSWEQAKRYLESSIRMQQALGIGLLLMFVLLIGAIAAMVIFAAQAAEAKAVTARAQAEQKATDAKNKLLESEKGAREEREAKEKAKKEKVKAEEDKRRAEEENNRAQSNLQLANREVPGTQPTPAATDERDLAQKIRDSMLAATEDSRRALYQARSTEAELRTIAAAAAAYLAGAGKKATGKELTALRQALEKQGYAATPQSGAPPGPQALLSGPVVLTGHKLPVETTTFLRAADMLQAVTGGKDHSVKLWSLDGKGREILKRDATSLASTSDGRLIVAGLDSFLRIWSSETLVEYKLPDGPAGEGIVSGRILPDGQVLFWTSRGRIGLWQTSGLPPVMFPPAHQATVNAVDFSSEKNWLLASGDDHLATLWSLEGGAPRLLHSLKAGAPVRGASFDSRGELALLPSGEKQIPLIRLGTAEEDRTRNAGTRFTLDHLKPVVLGIFSPDGDLAATADTDGRIYLWQTAAARSGNAATLPQAKVLIDHRRRVTALRWSPDGRFLASADEGGLVFLWQQPKRRATGEYGSLPLVFPSHQGAVTSLSVSPRGDVILSGGADATARILPLRPTITGRCRTTFGGPDDNSGGATEGLALLAEEDTQKPAYEALFLKNHDPARLGFARRLNPEQLYLAARWDYSVTSRGFLRGNKVTVRNPKTGTRKEAQAVDWGPAPSTGAVADLSPGLAKALGLSANDPVEVIADLIPVQAEKTVPPTAAP